ncbi:MaoC family dehydratase [Hymenobacter sp. 15J16-1T3B]|uniref:MaoC family dehydratase n=1 Tax=Hymenobacter sp. 15J16-1T3B TaxID=2886941 RepID=UPI001D11F104|nr:MaoC family dehydratase [Hymenobacter sp. 15J16-1T3B]MCC3159401.1 MaoC family dehydratase [Hymenobacter sp. 15J16-1T3B]
MLPALGASARLTQPITFEDVQAFARLSLDVNPLHLDEEYARQARFGRRICHGMLYASFISAVIGNELPGPGSIYVSQTLKFLKPVFAGDVITAVVTVTGLQPERHLVTLRTECVNQDAVVVLTGEAIILAPQ